MGTETYAYRGYYELQSVLAIKIDIVLEIIINSSSSADRGEEGTNDLKTLSEFC